MGLQQYGSQSSDSSVQRPPPLGVVPGVEGEVLRQEEGPCAARIGRLQQRTVLRVEGCPRRGPTPPPRGSEGGKETAAGGKKDRIVKGKIT